MRLRITSIRTFLLVAIVLLIAAGGTISALMNFKASQEQVAELFDAELAQMSRILQAMISSNRPLPSGSLANMLEYFDKEMLAQKFDREEYNVLGHKYERKLAFQVWNQQGQLVLENHSLLPNAFNQLQLGYQDLQTDNHKWRSFTLQDKLQGFWIRVAQQANVRTELTEEIAWHSTLPSLVLIPFLILISGLIIRKGLEPLAAISRELNDRDYNSLGSLNEAQYPRELTQLVLELNSLFKRVSESQERERRFTADAAHELRTPLAISKVHLQNIKQITDHPKINEFVDKSLLGLNRLIHMVQQLLTLSRLDAQLEQEPNTQIDIVLLCKAMIQELSETSALPNSTLPKLTVQLQMPEQLPLVASETGLRILLRNLLDNAWRYANPDSTIKVMLTPTELTIRNQCPRLDDQELAQIFDRFTRGKGSKKEGSGLGLSICQEICKLYGFTLRVTNRQDGEEGVDAQVIF